MSFVKVPINQSIMDNTKADSFSDHIQEIREFVKSSPELLKRLASVEMYVLELKKQVDDRAGDRNRGKHGYDRLI